MLEVTVRHICVFAFAILATVALFLAQNTAVFGKVSFGSGALSSSRTSSPLTTLSWNIAAINNNPFEYYISYKDEAKYEGYYKSLMTGVQGLIVEPGADDVPVSAIFTDAMFAELKDLMATSGMEGIDETEALWKSTYRQKKIISEFMKDRDIGKKRLTSMPDRFTNTILNQDGETLFRPTVINCYGGKLDSPAAWWDAWKTFMFKTPVPARKNAMVSSLLSKIKHAKYPAISESEEKISIPLQTVMLAVFDSILVHMARTATQDGWQPLREKICHKLNLKKNDRTLEILSTTYADTDIVFLQEVAEVFINKAKASSLGDHYHILSPAKMNKRDQNSVILAKKDRFTLSNMQEFSTQVISELGPKPPADNGDIFVIGLDDIHGKQYLFSSFHGDTNGLATKPVVSAVYSVLKQLQKNGQRTLLFGMDANTYEKGDSHKQDVTEFGQFYVGKGLTSCWGDKPNPKQYTTFNARTYLQPQLAKAAKDTEKLAMGDINPKDFILFEQGSFIVRSVTKDNTGNKEYTEGMVFPTLEFPSDHGVLSAVLVPQ